jgi:ribosome-associated protein
MIRVTDDIAIREDELVFKFSRSGGPGGQNVNKIDSRATLFFGIAACRGLSEEQKSRILTRLAGRITREGLLRIVSQRHRTQGANRRAAIERLVELLKTGIKERKVRKATAVPYAARQKRLERKKQRSGLKQQRKKVPLNHIGQY